MSDEAPDVGTAEEELEPAEALQELLEEIVEDLGLKADVTIEEGDGVLSGVITGEDVGLFIGRHGQTIDAVQYLLNVIAYRAYGEAKKDVVVDAAGYRERRRATLETLADEIADRVRESGQAEELEPMTSVERKVIHLRLKEVAGVATASEGTEPNRYVVVLPG
jgi:spoIIIJ-associated protein